MLCGLDAAASDLSFLEGKNVMLFCNHSSRDASDRHILDIISADRGIILLKSYIITAFGWDKYWPDSLLLRVGDPKIEYVDKPRLTFFASDVKDCDIIVLDMQGTGLSTDPVLQLLKSAMNLAGILGAEMYVLDRPVLIPPSDPWGPPHGSLYGLPYFHGLTVGECARYFAELGLMPDPGKLKIIEWISPPGGAGYNDLKFVFRPLGPGFEEFGEGRSYAYSSMLSFSSMHIDIRNDFAAMILWAEWLDAVWLKNALISDDKVFTGLRILEVPGSGITGLVLEPLGDLTEEQVFFSVIRAARAVYPAAMRWNTGKLDIALGNSDIGKLLTEPAPVQSFTYYWEPEMRPFRALLPEISLYRK